MEQFWPGTAASRDVASPEIIPSALSASVFSSIRMLPSERALGMTTQLVPAKVEMRRDAFRKLDHTQIGGGSLGCNGHLGSSADNDARCLGLLHPAR